jgi:Sec-independent protein translocase protein TatA
VFEGLFSPWHIVIIALALFLVFGPDALLSRWNRVSDMVKRLGEDDETAEATTGDGAASAPAAPPRPSLAHRLGRRFRWIHGRRRHPAG